jgi:hypothetical protein
VVAYGVRAADPDDPVKAIACTPASGSTFPLGATTVTCTDDTHLIAPGERCADRDRCGLQALK